jgi:hypothetical protein
MCGLVVVGGIGGCEFGVVGGLGSCEYAVVRMTVSDVLIRFPFRRANMPRKRIECIVVLPLGKRKIRKRKEGNKKYKVEILDIESIIVLLCTEA